MRLVAGEDGDARLKLCRVIQRPGIDIDPAQIMAAAEHQAAADCAIIAGGSVAVGGGGMVAADFACHRDLVRRKSHEADKGRA